MTGYLRSFTGLLLRDISVLRHNLPDFLLRTLVQPSLFVFVFAYLFPRIGQGIGASSAGFANVLVPGLVSVTAVFAGISTVSLPLAIELGATREIEDRVMAPLPVWALGVEKMVFGSLQSFVAAASVCWLAGCETVMPWGIVLGGLLPLGRPDVRSRGRPSRMPARGTRTMDLDSFDAVID